jgi:hypothetical protein
LAAFAFAADFFEPPARAISAMWRCVPNTSSIIVRNVTRGPNETRSRTHNLDLLDLRRRRVLETLQFLRG